MANRRDQHPFYFENGGTMNEESASVVTRHLKNLAIQIDGEFAATVTVMVRLDPSLSFVPLSSVMSPDIVYPPNDASYSDVKLTITDYVSGQVVAKLVGRTSQE